MVLSLLLVGVVLLSAVITAVSSDAPGVYAELWFHNDSQETAVVALANTYYNLTLLEPGESSFLTYANNHTINITYPGVYVVSLTMSFGDGANQEFHLSVGVNGMEMEDCHVARKLGTGGDVGNAGTSCILTLSTGDLITLMYENEGGTNDIDVQDANLHVVALQ